jgi:hypothetical protein
MTRRTIVETVDDLDGSEATETVRFSLDGTTYEIDLNDEHVAELRESLAPYVDAARHVGGRQTRGRARRDSSGRPHRGEAVDASPDLIRQWAREHGYEVSNRGRIPRQVVEAYEAAR